MTKEKIIKAIEQHKSFIKYTTVGIVKSAITVLLLFIFIDILEVKYRNIVRIIIVIFVFLLAYFLYKIIGYAK